jgi:amino acid transporter
MLGLTLYTFVTMVGGNPTGDKYGFRYWKTPGPFVPGTSVKERVNAIFDALCWATFA